MNATNPDETGEGLTPQQEKALVCVLSEPTLKGAAEAAGVGKVTLWRWMQTATFQERYREARRQAMSAAIARLQQISGEAVEVLREVMQDHGAQSAARVGAARTVLDMGLSATETEDLMARVEQLEREAEQTA